MGFEKEGVQIKMCKLGKKKNLASSWEGSYVFFCYKDGKGTHEQDEGARTCIIKDMDNKC